MCISQSKLCHYNFIPIAVGICAFLFFFCFCTERNKISLPIDFFQEVLTIEIKDDSTAKVTGTYFFENLTSEEKNIKFYYPFPVDSFHDFPDTILLDYSYEKDSAGTGIFFNMAIGARAGSQFTITYKQKLKGTFFRYITTTTKQWQRPIKKAYFEITAPAHLQARFNYPLAEDRIIGPIHYYAIKLKKFFPDEDLIIDW